MYRISGFVHPQSSFIARSRVTLIGVLFALCVTPLAHGAESEDPMALLSVVRQQLKLPPLMVDLDLSSAAQKHAAYIAATNHFDHEQSPSAVAFYAQQPSDRCKKAGYPEGCAEAMMRGAQDWKEAVSRFLRGPYHRFLLLNPDAINIGFAAAVADNQEQIHVITLGNGRHDQTQYSTISISATAGKVQRTIVPNKPAEPIRYVAWPQSLDASFRFDPVIRAGEEIPDPLSAAWPISGYLLSIQATQSFEVDEWTVADQEGATLDSEKMDGQIANARPGYSWILKTKRPFKPGQTYTTQAKVRDALGVSQTLNWQFTTKEGLIVPEDWRGGLKLKIGERKRLTVQSASGSIRWQGACVQFSAVTLESVEITANKVGHGCYVALQDAEFSTLNHRVALSVVGH